MIIKAVQIKIKWQNEWLLALACQDMWTGFDANKQSV